MPLIQRLRERKLVRWALAYIAGAWVVYEVASTVAGDWGVSPWLLRGLSLLLVSGLIAVLVLAWYHGEKGRQAVTLPEFMILAALLSLTLWGVSHLTREGVGTRWARPYASDLSAPKILVVPFEDLSRESADAYVAAGFHLELDPIWDGLRDHPRFQELLVEYADDVDHSGRPW